MKILKFSLFLLFLTINAHALTLLVDGDRGFPFEYEYIEAFKLAGQKFTHWDVAKKGTPPLLTLEKHKVVLWITDGSNTPFSFEEAHTLASYLQKKGKVIVMGYNTGYALHDMWLDQAFFGFEYKGSTLEPVEIQEYTGNKSLSAKTDYVETQREGMPLYHIQGSFHAPLYGKVCAVKTSKTFWFGFDIKDIDSLFSRAELLDKAINNLIR